jgi:hypothetical protein
MPQLLACILIFYIQFSWSCFIKGTVSWDI